MIANNLDKYNNRDHLRALTWAKKIKSINYLGGKCEKCGTDNIFVLEFHHSNGVKEECISRILNKTNTNIMRELEKCTLLCRNCHAEYHYNSAKKSKVILLDLIGYKECRECKHQGSSFASLDFHHFNRKTKKFRMSSIGIYGELTLSYKKKILKELNKCIVLCKNCHMIGHIDQKYYSYIEPLIKYKLENHIEHKSPEPKRSDAINKKGSEYRNKLALWLTTWKKMGTVSMAAKYLGVKNNMLSENLMQSRVYRKIRKRLSIKSSRYVGVSWSKKHKKWISHAKVNGKNKYLGVYDCEKEARDAFITFRKSIHNKIS